MCYTDSKRKEVKHMNAVKFTCFIIIMLYAFTDGGVLAGTMALGLFVGLALLTFIGDKFLDLLAVGLHIAVLALIVYVGIKIVLFLL